MSIKHWLKNQLTKVKTKEEAWSDFSSILGNALDVHVEPHLERVKRRVSLFEQGKEDLQVELNELGDFFSFGDIDSENLAITILQRKDQIHFKRTLSPLISTLNREFYGIGVKWQALYNPIDQEYGVGMITQESVGGTIDLSKYWLTSRGIIQVPINDLLDPDQSLNEVLDDLENKIERVVKPLIPLRIVYDGVLYIIIYHLKERSEHIELVEVGVKQSIDYNLTKSYRMDALPIDCMTLDYRLTHSVEDTLKQRYVLSRVKLPRLNAPDAGILKPEPTEAIVKVGGDLVYSYRMDAAPIDIHSLDYQPEHPREKETIAHTDKASIALPKPLARWKYRMDSSPIDAEPIDRLMPQSGYVRFSAAPNNLVTKKERSESIRMASIVVDGIKQR